MLALEGPQFVAVVHLKFEEGAFQGLHHGRRHDAAGRVPGDVRAAVVLGDLAPLVVDVVEFESTVETVADARQNEAAARGGPRERVAGAVLEREELGEFLLVVLARGLGLRRVERDVRSVGGRGFRAVHDREAVAAVRLPGERKDGELDLEVFHRHQRLVDAEQLERREQRLLGLRVAQHLHAQVLAVGMPEHLTVTDVHQVALAQFFPRGQLHQGHARRRVALLGLGGPVRDHVAPRRPLKVDDAVRFEGFAIQ
mmetsp:Transcript_3291/g.10104  ORF Transcript_3291/g.10104 Transcript_3291/m.10104 type:complete len:255 (-) Transcript_3291:367-1131(-)